MKNKSKSIKNVLLVGGGTGGHAVPLVNLYNFFISKSKEYKNINYNFIWIGENDSIEEKLAKQNNIKFKIIKSGKLRRYFSFQNIVDFFKFIYGIFQSIYLVLKIKPDFIFSKGGYVALPVMIAGKILRKKIFLHESDSIPGLANKIGAKFSDKVFLSFGEAKKYFKDSNLEKNKAKYIVSGPILPEIFLKKSNNLVYNKTNKTKKTKKNINILVICGSQGSTLIFKNILNILSNNKKFNTEKDINNIKYKNYNFRIILGTKNAHFREEFSNFKNVKLVDFCTQKELAGFYKESDIAITRGSSSIFELALFKIKMIIIPFKYSGSNHQELNARVFEKLGHIVIKDDDLNKKVLKKSIDSIVNKKIKFNNLNNTNSLNIIYKTIGKLF